MHPCAPNGSKPLSTMPHTYQPFAETPAVDQLRQELTMNVPEKERLGGAIAGGLLLLSGLLRPLGTGRWPLVVAGGALLWRSATGHCPLYQNLGIDRRHGRRADDAAAGVKVEGEVEVACPAEALYAFWHNLEALPRVMRHVESVHRLENNRSHWTVRGLAGETWEWDAEIINEHPGRLIAWRSLPDASVRNAGSVWFEPVAGGRTRVKVAFDYDPPGGRIGGALVDLLGRSPAAFLREDLESFRQFAEKELAPRAAEEATGDPAFLPRTDVG